MALPDTLPEFATDDAYPADAAPEAEDPNKTEPSSDLKASGWRPGQKPPAQIMNWLLFTIGAWIKWAFTELKSKNLHCSRWYPEDADALTESELDGGMRDVPTAPQELYLDVDLPVGATLDGLRAKVWQLAGGATVTMEIYKAADDLTEIPELLEQYTPTLVADTVTNIGADTGLDIEIEEGFTYWAWIYCDSGTVRLGNTKIAWFPVVL